MTDSLPLDDFTPSVPDSVPGKPKTPGNKGKKKQKKLRKKLKSLKKKRKNTFISCGFSRRSARSGSAGYTWS